MAGQGTVGLEIFEDQPALDALLVPVGGGGLVSGIAAIASQLRPNTRIIAVEPDRAADLHESLSVGKVVAWDRKVTATTIADGLRAPFVGDTPWQVIRTQLTEALTVSDEMIRAAMRLVVQHTNTIVEPSGAVATAALLQYSEMFSGLRVGAVVSGGNLGLDQFTKLLAP